MGQPTVQLPNAPGAQNVSVSYPQAVSDPAQQIETCLAVLNQILAEIQKQTIILQQGLNVRGE